VSEQRRGGEAERKIHRRMANGKGEKTKKGMKNYSFKSQGKPGSQISIYRQKEKTIPKKKVGKKNRKKKNQIMTKEGQRNPSREKIDRRLSNNKTGKMAIRADDQVAVRCRGAYSKDNLTQKKLGDGKKDKVSHENAQASRWELQRVSECIKTCTREERVAEPETQDRASLTTSRTSRLHFKERKRGIGVDARQVPEKS